LKVEVGEVGKTLMLEVVEEAAEEPMLEVVVVVEVHRMNLGPRLR
jgi:hypothetical protein